MKLLPHVGLAPVNSRRDLASHRERHPRYVVKEFVAHYLTERFDCLSLSTRRHAEPYHRMAA